MTRQEALYASSTHPRKGQRLQSIRSGGLVTEMLAFEAGNSWPPDEPNCVDSVSQEGETFSIMVAGPVPSGGLFNFSVQNVDALCEQLKDRAEVVEPLFDTAYGSRKFTIRDPDGNELGFVEG